MKKYIRTKDRVWESEDYWKRTPTEIMTLKEDIIKQADTVKELCDKFVLMGIDVIILNEDNTQYRFEGESEWYDITDTEIQTGIYGAVWSDKGLINVAKMNKQRELELI